MDLQGDTPDDAGIADEAREALLVKRWIFNRIIRGNETVCILHSGIRRARETADVVASFLCPEMVQQIESDTLTRHPDDVSLDDDLDELIGEIRGHWECNPFDVLVIVGHHNLAAHVPRIVEEFSGESIDPVGRIESGGAFAVRFAEGGVQPIAI